MEFDLAKIAASVVVRCPEAEVRVEGSAIVAGPFVLNTLPHLWLIVGYNGCFLTPALIAVLRAVLDAVEDQMGAADEN